MRMLVIYPLSFILLVSPASATLINLGDVTRDTATNLDWLDLTLTTNLSFEDIESGAGA